MPLFRTDKNVAAASDVGRVQATLVEITRNRHIGRDQWVEYIEKSRDLLWKLREDNEDVAALAEHPGWLKVELAMRNTIKSMMAAEHENVFHNPEEALLNYLKVELIKTFFLNKVEAAHNEITEADKTISQIEAQLTAIRGREDQ